MILKLDGSVTGPWVDELRRACNTAMGNGARPNPLILDLAEVHFIDPAGIRLFRDLVAQRVSLSNASAFAAEQLKGVSNGRE